MNLNQCLKSSKTPYKKYNHIPSSSTSETQLLASRHNVDSADNSSESSLTENDELGDKVEKLTGFTVIAKVIKELFPELNNEKRWKYMRVYSSTAT